VSAWPPRDPACQTRKKKKRSPSHGRGKGEELLDPPKRPRTAQKTGRPLEFEEEPPPQEKKKNSAMVRAPELLGEKKRNARVNRIAKKKRNHESARKWIAKSGAKKE